MLMDVSCADSGLVCSLVSSLNTILIMLGDQLSILLMLAIKVQHQILFLDLLSVTFPLLFQLFASLSPLLSLSPTLVCTDPFQLPFPLMDTAQSPITPEELLKCVDFQS